MDELTDCSSTIVEFVPTINPEKLKKLIDNSTGTDPLPVKHEIAIGTAPKVDAQTQTQLYATGNIQVDERKLAKWLQKIYPTIAKELLQGPTPIPSNYIADNYLPMWDDAKIQTYQKILLGNDNGSCQVLATWLSVHTNNAPALVISAVAAHDNWCAHINQNIKLFVPKRVHPGGSFVVYTEVKSLPLKACMQSLCTNAFNKNIFAGSTMNGDLYVWQFEQTTSGNVIDVKELHVGTCVQGFAIAMDWCTEQRLLTCHTNGVIMQWLLGKQLILEAEFSIRTAAAASTSSELTSMISLNANDFVVGTKDGSIYHCWHNKYGAMVKRTLETTALRKHSFMVSTLLKTKMSGHTIVISCDLSGQVYYHDMRTADNETVNVIIETPLPFKNAIACTRDGNIIFCPGTDGSLECYRIGDGAHSVIKGALRGKGNLIKCSDNGGWLITGLYENYLQIFHVQD